MSYLAKNNLLRNIVKQKILGQWFSEQRSGRLKKSFSNSKKMNISHETIYKSLFIQAEGVFKKELTDILDKKSYASKKTG